MHSLRAYPFRCHTPVESGVNGASAALWWRTLKRGITIAGLGLMAAFTATADSSITNRPAILHWAFQPLAPIRLTGRAATHPIDAFWQPAPKPGSARRVTEASRAVLIRRLSFGLTGLPPTVAMIDAFERDSRSDAYPRVVDTLLNSPHFGEAWGRHWLDLARYADSNGYEDDDDRKLAWPYRDWVIRALNEDLPFDTFVTWQLAGDECEPGNPDAVTATGFITAALSDRFPPTITEENKLVYRYNELDDMVSTTGSAMLGLTIGCARCHDHKTDPIGIREYYGLVSAFSTGRRVEATLNKPQRDWKLWKARQKRAYREAMMATLGLREEERIRVRHSEFDFVFDANDLLKRYPALEPSDATLRAWLGAEDQRIWDGLMAAAQHGAGREAGGNSGHARESLVFLDTQPEALPEYVLNRGSVRHRTEPTSVRFPAVLCRGRDAGSFLNAVRPDRRGIEVDADGFVVPASTFQRRALAAWLTDVDHGAGFLLARVVVNRLWQHHFGEGLVRTPSDFGTQGDSPSNAALLDWLAGELIRQQWHLKPIHRLVLTSGAYRASAGTVFSPRVPGDVSNRPIRGGQEDRNLMRRPLRLEAESVRDSLLSVSGRLNRTMFGPPFRPRIPKEAIATRSRSPYPADLRDDSETFRRSIYAFVKRSVRNPMMEVFDAPDPTSACGRRNTTTVPTQALTLLNDEWVRECAVQFAQRVFNEAGSEPVNQVDRAFRLALGRLPTAPERTRALKFLGGAADARDAGIPTQGLTDFCHLLFTLNEFLYAE